MNKINQDSLVVVAHTLTPITWEAEIEGSLLVQGHLGLHIIEYV